MIAATLPLIALIRIHPDDVPWHLATARLAEHLGHWPTRNTFSFTFPDYPLYQQYPVFQALALAVHRLAGWAGLSGLLFTGWTLVFVLFVRWGGPLRSAAPLHTVWMFVLLSLQTRMALRPDMLSLTLLALELLVIDAYRERDRRALLALPLLHWVWVNGHQLFVLSFAVQAAFLGHLLLCRFGRFGVDRRDAALPVWPAAAALVASVGASLLTPLGREIVYVFAHTSGSLAHHRHHVQELARVWSDPTWLVIGLVPGLAAALALLRTRRAWSPFDVGVWLLGLAMAVSAIRGLVYFTLLSGAVFERALVRQPVEVRASKLLRAYLRVLAVTLTATVTGALLYHRHVAPSPELGRSQPGLGRTRGDWADASVTALRADPPAGRMMNVPWELANLTLWSWPERSVFVDPRFEAYPRAFLNQVIASYGDDAIMDRLIEDWRPDWIFGAHCRDDLRPRLVRLARTPAWAITAADVDTLVLVRRVRETEAYRARHHFDPTVEPRGLEGPLALRARQRLCWARLLQALGYPTGSSQQ